MPCIVANIELEFVPKDKTIDRLIVAKNNLESLYLGPAKHDHLFFV